jgi:hypothetical protein
VKKGGFVKPFLVISIMAIYFIKATTHILFLPYMTQPHAIRLIGQELASIQ